MADYYILTVIQQTILDSDMTPLERLRLSHIFDAERGGEGWHFFSEIGRTDRHDHDRARRPGGDARRIRAGSG